ncbi:MAG: PLP-dependent aminotransferase family protein [Ornithinimicrobium sp.]
MQRVLSGDRVRVALGQAPWSSPVHLDLSERLRAAMTDGRLSAGSRMPSERELTRALGLSRTTVTRAYAALRENGYLVTRPGSGSVVHLPDVPGGRIDHLLSPGGAGDEVIDLTTTASPAGPWLHAAYSEAMEAAVGYLPGVGYYPSGLPVLRDLVAQRFRDRGLPTSADQVLIVNGALSGVAVASSMMARARRSAPVLLESPTYPNAIATLGAAARLVAHPVSHHASGEQWDPDGLEAVLRQSRPRAAYLVPDFHNPTGALMDTAQRQRVGAALQRSGTVPVIDETPVDLAADETTQASMPPPLACFVPDAITVGGVNKSFWGGLRIGWMRVPRSRHAQAAASRLALDLGTPVLEQLAAVSLLSRADDILPERRRSFRVARDALRQELQHAFPSWSVPTPAGGLTLWCELPRAISTELVRAASRNGLMLAAGPSFAPAGGMDRYLRLPYVLPPEDLVEAVRRLGAAWTEVERAGSFVGERNPAPPIIA